MPRRSTHFLVHGLAVGFVLAAMATGTLADERGHGAIAPAAILEGLRGFYGKTAREDGSFAPGIDPEYRGMSDSAYSDLAAVTYAVVLHKTFGWKLPNEGATAEFLLARQRPNGDFFNVAGTVDPMSAEGRVYNTTQGLVALRALGLAPKHDPLPVFEEILKQDYKTLPAYSTSFFPLAYLCYGKPIPPEADRRIRATMVQADDGYLNDHVAATFHAAHYYRLVGEPTPKADRIIARILRDQKEDGSWMLNMPSRDRHATFDAVFTLHQLGPDRDDCRKAIDRAVRWILSCRNPDGGFGHFPGSTSDADAIYFQVGALVMAGVLQPVDPLPKDPHLLSWGHLMPRPLAFPRIPATEPKKAAATFEVRDGFRMELIAAEPLVTSPVALEYDEDGRGWVLEMRDYPFTDKTTDKPLADKSADLPLGRIRVLRDTDGDGAFDDSQIFADEISWPTGLAFWKGGVFVAATPDLWYLKDTDGDGKADLREKLFTGFRKYNIQAVINNLRWGLDHHIYGAGGTNGGKIESLGDPNAAAIALAANDFRIDPVTTKFEALSGGARFGQSFDDWGNRFLCNIRNPVIHVVLPAHYLARNPAVPVQKALFDVADAGDTLPVYRISPSEAWRRLRAQRWSGDAEGLAYPRSELVPDGYFTSACGITIYRGSAYPAEYAGQAFLSDVASNLVHREALSPAGVTFKSRRIDDHTEFVRSTDIWFRPVNFVNAPDGTLHVVDMYRETIEHPWSIPEDIKAALDLESGRDRGRLWRLAPPGFKSPKPARLGRASTAELVAELENPNAWHRETAHRLLFERQDQSAAGPLRGLLENSSNPLARLHALWSLDGLGALTDGDLLRGLADAIGGVREHAVRLAEPRLNSIAKLRSRVIELAEDPDPRVRFQVAFSLGEVEHGEASAALIKIARSDAGNEHIRAAVLSSSARRSGRLLTGLLADQDFAAKDEARLVIRLLAQTLAAGNSADDLKAVGRILVDAPTNDRTRPWKTEVIGGLGEGMKRRGKTLAAVFADVDSRVNTLMAELLAGAGRVAVDPKAGIPERVQAAQMLGSGRYAAARESLEACLDPQQPPALQLAAIRTLAAFSDEEGARRLLTGWRTYSPPVRTEVVEALLARRERIPLLFDEIQEGRIGVGQVSAVRRGLLMKHADAAIRERARALFARDAHGPRADVVKEYEEKLPALTGIAERGRVTFERECATCHRLAGKGVDVGPNLETIRHHAPRQVLANILDPGREVSPAYIDYVVVTKEGRTATGLVSSETATSITLRRPNDVVETILRENIEEIASSGKSLMPEGFEKKIPPQEMADLLAFLLGPKSTPPPAGLKSD